jgi:hypothetical protein
VLTLSAFFIQIDPEARPSAAELLKMLVELAAGRPLPPYQLSTEAIRRREERIAADQLREAKTKKKAAPVVPPRKGAPPSSNSVAAKRLAAKRGHSAPYETSSSEALGSEFSQSNSAITRPFSTNIASSRTDNVNLFDADVDNGENEQGWDDQPQTGSFDPFDNDEQPTIPAGRGNRTSDAAVPTFDPFADDQPEFSSKTFCVQHSAFIDFSFCFWFFTDPPSTVRSSAFVRRPSSELEEPFSPSASNTKQKQSSSFEGFEEFSNGSDPFATQPTTVQAIPTSFAGVSSDLLFNNSDIQSSTRSGFSNFDNSDVPRVPPTSRQTSMKNTNFDSFDAPQAAPSRQTSTRSNFDLPQAPPSRQTSARSVNRNLLGDDDNNGTTAPPPSRATSAFTNDFDSDFSLPTAPSRTNSVRNSSNFSAFGNDDDFINQQSQLSSSKPTAASLLFELETSLPPAAVLTPTPQNSGKSSTNGVLDLLHSSSSSESGKTQQRKSNPLELLNLYDQPLQPTKSSPAPVMLGMNPHASNSPAFMNLPPAGGRTSIPISPFNPSPMTNHMSSTSPGMRSPGMPYIPPNPMASSNPNLMMYPPRTQFSNPGGPNSMGIGGLPYGSPMYNPGGMNANRGMPPPPPNPFAKGPTPNAGMRTSYGVNSDPFDSLSVLNNKK